MTTPSEPGAGLIYRCDYLGCETPATSVLYTRFGSQLYWCDDHIPSHLSPGQGLSRLRTSHPSEGDAR